MAVGACAFVWLEPLNGSVYLLVSDVVESSAGRGVLVVWVNAVILWGREEE